jgi:hypothetical protein
MTKKRIGTKRRRRVKKQMRQKSRKMRKSMRGGTREFIEKISRCIPNNPRDYPDIPFSPSGYINNDDNWTKLAENISHNGPIEFVCDGETAIIGGIDENLNIDYITNTKRGELYGKIGESRPILLWRNGRQQTREPPVTPRTTPRPRTRRQFNPHPINRIVDTIYQNRSPPGSPLDGRRLFNDGENPDDNRDFYPQQ